MTDASATRFCARCNTHKPTSEFYASRTTAMCRVCDNARQRESYRPWVEYVAAYKLKHGCMECGYRDHPAALELDHRPGTVKVDQVSNLVRRRLPFDVIDAEIAKCDVLCANCHRIRTVNRIEERIAAQESWPERPDGPEQLRIV